MQPLDVAHFIGGNVRRLIKPQRVLQLALGLAEAPSHRVVLTRIAVAATAPIGVVAQQRLSMRISFPPDHDGVRPAHRVPAATVSDPAVVLDIPLGEVVRSHARHASYQPYFCQPTRGQRRRLRRGGLPSPRAVVELSSKDPPTPAKTPTDFGRGEWQGAANRGPRGNQRPPGAPAASNCEPRCVDPSPE